MPSAPLPPSSQATAAVRDRGDACPGALRLHSAHDGALARVRLPGGVLRTDQAAALGQASLELGDGDVHLTSRGNVQLRGLDADDGVELARRLAATGLLPSPRHERVRNIVASPLSGLDGREHRDVRPWLTALDGLLCASDTASGLSGRFLFALDDGRGDVAALDADVTLRAAPDEGALLRLGACGVLRVPAADGPRSALLAAEVFLEASGGQAWRVAELPTSVSDLTAAVAGHLRACGIPVSGPVETSWTFGTEPEPGVVTAPDGTTALSVLAPLGRMAPAQWAQLTTSASRELRLTPWRGVIVPDSPAELLHGLTAAGLITSPASALAGVGACIGRPGCAKAQADVRADATTTSTDMTRTDSTDAGGGLPVYWSGCERRCGHPPGDHVDVVAGHGATYQISVRRAGRTRTVTTHDNPSQRAAALAVARQDNA
ncbi:cobalamin biosynthesis protein CobG [Streptomyces sp. NPDC050439]|uniref:cobalamin biosynthesis protein CobG n=1 Tax=unclassified Streptomyces TaxID=2593676 RepID=UPI003445295E